MKKIILFSLVMAIGAIGAIQTSAQKFALIDMEYILKNIQAYEMAN
jgi:outer membrane protein